MLLAVLGHFGRSNYIRTSVLVGIVFDKLDKVVQDVGFVAIRIQRIDSMALDWQSKLVGTRCIVVL